MPTEWATAKAEELLPTKGITSRSWASCTRYYRPAVAAALDAAREQGREEERERWRERIEVEAERLEAEETAARRKYHLPTAYVAQQQAIALRSLLSPAEVAGREEG